MDDIDGNEEVRDDPLQEIINPILDDDLLGQAKEVGKTTINLGKKTGKLAFNLARLGITKMNELAQKEICILNG